MVIKVDVFGEKEVKSFLKTKEKNVVKLEQQGLKNAALFMQGEVKASIAGQRAEPTSVDTGRFLNSVDFQVGKDDAVVYTDLEYPKFLEYGTSKLIPRKHFQNSKARNQSKAIGIVESEIKKV